VGVLPRRVLDDGLTRLGPQAVVAAVMKTAPPAAHPGEMLDVAIARLREDDGALLLVANDGRLAHGSHFFIVVVAEGAKPIGGTHSIKGNAIGQAERVGGADERIAAGLEALTGHETRAVVLGRLLRGGSPTPADRLWSLRFGAAAVRALPEGQSGVMVALDSPVVKYVKLEDATRRMETVPLDCDTVPTARDIGIGFGD